MKIQRRTGQNGHRQSHDPARLAIKCHSFSLIWQNPPGGSAHKSLFGEVTISGRLLHRYNMLRPSAHFIPPPSRPSPCLCFVQQVWKSSTRQHANQTGKSRVTQKRKPKPDSSENKVPSATQGIQGQAISKKGQSWSQGSFLGELKDKTTLQRLPFGSKDC